MVSTKLLINAKDAANFLSIVGSLPRLQILVHLLNDGEMSVNVLCQKMNCSQSSLSQHLAKLRWLSLVKTRRDSQWVYYSCGSSAVRDLLSTLEAIYGEGREPIRNHPFIVKSAVR
jgi:DNA-binding transcriptional ArsR family regulator